MKYFGYNYYDTPEGEDCHKKLWYTTQHAALWGVGVSTYDIFLYSHPKGYVQALARYAHFTFPFIGMAAAFTTTVCISTQLRKKDDKLNYNLGAIAAGGVFGIWRKSFYLGLQGTMLFCLIATLKKMSKEDGWEFFPGPGIRRSGDVYARLDHTWTMDPGRTWKKSANE